MKYYSDRNHTHKKRYMHRWLLVLLLLAIVGGAVYWFANNNRQADAPQQNTQQQTTEDEPEEPPYTPIDLQPVVDQWLAKYPATYGIVIYDAQSKSVIAENEPERVFFAASLYKLFVAYLSLLDFQTGAQDPNEIILAGQTRRECVDKMIRSSDSPCGETIMADIGQTVLNQRVAEMGMTGTFFNGIRTSPRDTALILQYILEKRDLNEENTAFLRDAMRNQDLKWRYGLAYGAPDAVWDTKVGWNLDINYHDVGIMTLPDGREFVVSILGEGSGKAAPIADFAKTIYTALTQ